MTREQKHQVAHEIFENMNITREQYEQFKKLVDDFDLTKVEDWSDIEEAFK